MQANVLIPGTTLPPDLFTFTCPGAHCPTLLASTITSWTNSTSTTSGSFTAAVFSDPFNTFGAGDLDFVYQVSNASGSQISIGRVSGTTFTGFQTDVGYASNGATLGPSFVNGTVAPELVDRATADTIGFSFNAPVLALIAPGQTSTVLIIETNATNFIAGNANIYDGGPTNVAAYEPLSRVTAPEPASWLLMSAGLLALSQIRRFMKA